MGRVILDSDEEDVEESVGDEFLATKPEQPQGPAQEDNSSGTIEVRLQQVIEETHAELVEPTPSQKRNRARDDTVLTPNTSAKKAKLRRISSTGTPVAHSKPLGNIEPNATTSLIVDTGVDNDHETQGGDTELASSTMPRFQFDTTFRDHNPQTLFPDQSTNGNESNGGAASQELAERAADASTQQTSTATFPSLEDASQVHANQGSSKGSPSRVSEPILSGLVAGDYLEIKARDGSIPIVDIPPHKRTPTRATTNNDLRFSDSPDELARTEDIRAQIGKTNPKPRANRQRSQMLSEGLSLDEPRPDIYEDNVKGLLDDNIVDEDEIVIGNPSQKARRRVVEEPDETKAEEEKATKKPVDRENSKRKRGRPRTVKTLDAEDEVHNSANEQEDATNNQTDNVAPDPQEERVAIPNRRKRGRPKRVQPLEATEEPSAAQDGGGYQDNPDSESQPGTVAVQESDANTNTLAEGKAQTIEQRARTAPAEESNTDARSASPNGYQGTLQSTPPKPSIADPKPPSHSPLNKGRVPFKVGLSKKARIEPLLRMMKK